MDPLPGSPEVVDFNASGYQCLTTHPSSTNYHGHNGCANHNAGVSFPGGIPTFKPPEFTNGAHIAVPADSGLSPATTSNPAFYATNDPEQYFNGAIVRSFSVNESPSVSDVSEGVDFHIYHNGTFSNADFSVTQVRFFNRTKANFEVAGGALPPGTFEFYTQSEYDTAISQSYVASEDDLGKPVPAMGAFGLTALLIGLFGITGKLIQQHRK